MSLDTLLEAAKYVEYHSEAQARGEEPHDYCTFFKLYSAGEDGLLSPVEQVPQKRQQTLSNSSHSSDEIKEKRRAVNPVMRELSQEHLSTGTREVHNKLEKNRRAHLKECFEALKKQIPNMDERKTSNLSILRGAIRFIQVLKKKETQYEREMEMLAHEKIAFQHRLLILKKELATQLDHVDVNQFIPEEDNETTTTASECGALSDFDDSLPRENSTLNSSSDFTSSSSSSTVSSVLVGPVPSTASYALPKQSYAATIVQSPASIKEPLQTSNQYTHESLLAGPIKTSMASPLPPTLTAHQLNSESNTAQTTRVYSTGNIHAMAGILASPHTMQVITQPSGIKVYTTPTSIMASNSSVQHISVNHQPHGQIVITPSSNASYASSISATSKAFTADSLVQVASSTSKSISRPHLVSPLALISPQTMVGLSHNSAGKSLANSATLSDLMPPQGSSGSLNLSHKGGSVISGNMAIAVKNSLPPNSIVSCAPHSNMIATLHMSKAHSQVIQPSMASSIITQGVHRTSEAALYARDLKDVNMLANRLGTHINNGTHHGVSPGLKPIASTPVRSLPHLAGVAHVVVSQSPLTAPVGQIVTPGNHVSTVTPLVGSVSVVSHPGAVHQQSIGKVLASPVLKSVNQINQIPIIQQQFLQQVTMGSSSQPIVKPVVVVSMPNVVSSSNMSPLTSFVNTHEQHGSVRGSGSHK